MGSLSTTQSNNKAFLSTTGMVMLAFVLSRVLGLIRDSLLGSTFGASAELDALSAASRVTDTLYILVAGGALASAFIPTFTAYLVRGEQRMAWKIASAITNLVIVGTLLASLVTAIIAPWLVATVLAPGYEAEVQALTVSLLRIMLASTVIFGISGLLMGILNANDHFLLPALAPSAYNAGIIVGIVFLARWWGIHGVAVGTVFGALLHLLVQLPAFKRIDWTYSPILGLRLAGVRNVARLMGPRVLGLAITQLNFWININLASRLVVEGVVSALKLGFSLMLLPQGVVAQAMAVVLFPAFSAQAAREDQGALRTTLVSASQVIIYLTLPATVGLILLSQPIVQMFFQRNAFDSQDVAMVAWALIWYAVGLVAHSQLEIVTRAFYALHDTATPVWVGGGAMALNIVLSLLLMRLFGWLGMGYAPASYQPWMPLGGLALANSLATILETLTLNGLLRPRLDGSQEDRPGPDRDQAPGRAGLGGTSLWGSLWRTMVGAAAMTVVLWGFLSLVPTQNAWIRGLGGMLIGAATYLLVTWLLHSPEIAFALTAARSRVAK